MQQSDGRAKKRFGQNFLHDQNIISQLLHAIAPQASDAMLEIGPGRGALTEHLYQRVARLDLVEIDRDLIHFLQKKFAAATQLRVHAGDVLAFQLSSLSFASKRLPSSTGVEATVSGGDMEVASCDQSTPKDTAYAHKQSPAAQTWRVVGNLPYNISTPLLFHLFAQQEHIIDMHFMLQREVVQRMAAVVGDSSYGRLSIMTQYYCQVQPLFEVPATAFKPAPKVVSCVVRLLPHQKAPYLAHNIQLFQALVREAFCYRRKTLQNALKRYVQSSLHDQISALGLDLKLRPQQWSGADYAKLANFLNLQPS